MTADFVIKAHDEVPPLSGTVMDSSGNAVDLTGYTLLLNMRPMRSSDLVVEGQPVTIDQLDLELFPASKGTWHYDLDLADIEGDTGYFFELIATDDDGNERTFPVDGFHTLAVYARLAEPAS